MKSKVQVLLLILFTSVALFGQNKKLTYEQVFQFKGPRLVKQLPRINGWSDEDNYLQMLPDDNGKMSLTKINAVSGEKEIVLSYAEWNEQLPEGFTLDRAKQFNNYKQFLIQTKESTGFLNVESGSFVILPKVKTERKNIRVSPNGNYLAYTIDKDLYIFNVEDEEEIRLTNDASDVVYNGWSSWVYMEEILGRSTGYAAYWWAPNSESIAFMKFDDSEVPEFTLFNAEGQHGEIEKQRYPKAGDPNPKAWIGVVNVKTQKTTWLDAKGDNNQYIAWPYWSKDSKTLYFEWLNRKMDNLKLFAANPADGSKKEVYDEKQKTWVDWAEDIYFFDNNSGFIMRSAVDGYYHLYYYNNSGELISRITEGEWDVTSIAYVDETNSKIFFHARKGETTDQHLFSASLDGDNLTQLTKERGWHSCRVSDNGKYFYDRWSSINSTAKIDLFDGNGNFIKNLADSKSEIADEYNLAKVELFTIPSGDGYNLPAKWYLPPDFDETKKYPVIFSIYGGPGAGTVKNSQPYWMSDYFLAQEGIIVISVDHRGSGHFGKKGVDQMHRNLGKWELHDYIAAVKWLEEKPFIDTNKIAINGGSYGGYMTCYALTAGSDYFDFGVAEYSVTDWKLYDNVYTERYMDTPEENPEGYKTSSAVLNSDKYKGGMLITHGSLDDNVHMQNTLQLINRLENNNKDFEMMIYPNERHGVRFPKFFHSQRNKLKFWFKNLLGRELN